MMGIINNLVLALMEKEGKKDEVMKKLGLEKEYDAEVAYPEEEFQRLVGECCKVLNIDSDTFQEKFAEFVIPILREKFPGYFEVKSAKEFIVQIPTIHGLATTAGTAPKLMVVKNTDKEIHMIYSSPNKLCTMAKALLRKVVELYGESAQVKEKECMKKGDDYCKIIIEW